MNKTRERTLHVVVSGDVSVDWNIARMRRNQLSSSNWNPDDGTRACWQRGGAALLGDLVEAVAAGLVEQVPAGISVAKAAQPQATVVPGDPAFHHSYALWSLFKYGEETGSGQAWRVAEFLGLDRSEQEWAATQQPTGPAASAIDLLILDDADLGFRSHRELWSDLLDRAAHASWLVLKMAKPVADGGLWQQLHRRFSGRLIVILNVNDLRRSEVQISRDLSWERTAQDLAWELVHNPRINALSDCAAVVVSFETAGAFLFRDRRSTLLFDPAGVEGSWGKGHPGGMIGYNTCLTAGVVRQLLLSPTAPNLKQGIQAGVAAMRSLHREGYGIRDKKGPDLRLAFPLALVADELAQAKPAMAAVEVQDPLRFLTGGATPEQITAGRFWTILHDRHADSLAELARRIVLEGADAVLNDVPWARFGNLLTVDRQEMESFRSIRTLFGEYCSQKRPKRPVSIAVFGAPGAGKSFGISEIAKALLPGVIQKLEFNLSQLAGAGELCDAFHQVRDTGLSGFMPLVFFDEFDTSLDGQPLGWLRHFLAPMQDGAFRHGQLIHPIGPALFVFAGGTSETMESFDHGPADPEFRKVKGPDFVSRLKGYVNILGPNPVGGDVRNDRFFVLRRAILLRSLIAQAAPQLLVKTADGRQELQIDDGVLNALLLTSRYRHGARSMEALLSMSQLAGKSVFERSCLPSEAQLDLHVKGVEFLSLVQQLVLTKEVLERLAAAAHEAYCHNQRSAGFVYGEGKDVKKKTNPMLVDYADLPDSAKEANRVNVRTIPQKLAAAGYVLIPARSNQPPLEFPGADTDRLARLEHELWMAAKLAAGFEVGKPTAKDPRRNPYLLPWDQLSEEVKDIDRDLVRGIPAIVSKAGFALVKIRQ